MQQTTKFYNSRATSEMRELMEILPYLLRVVSAMIENPPLGTLTIGKEIPNFVIVVVIVVAILTSGTMSNGMPSRGLGGQFFQLIGFSSSNNTKSIEGTGHYVVLKASSCLGSLLPLGQHIPSSDEVYKIFLSLLKDSPPAKSYFGGSELNGVYRVNVELHDTIIPCKLCAMTLHGKLKAGCSV